MLTSRLWRNGIIRNTISSESKVYLNLCRFMYDISSEPKFKSNKTSKLKKIFCMSYIKTKMIKSWAIVKGSSFSAALILNLLSTRISQINPRANRNSQQIIGAITTLLILTPSVKAETVQAIAIINTDRINTDRTILVYTWIA